MNNSAQSEATRKQLTTHFESYPSLQAEDIFKYLFQSAFGCEHLVSSEATVLTYINHEYATVSKTAAPHVEPLDGEYSRVHLSYLNSGLAPKTLARLFCLSAKDEPNGKVSLEQKLQIAQELVLGGALALDATEFAQKLAAWKNANYPALHHSNTFRSVYNPAYRVIANRYVTFLPLLAKIDRLLEQNEITVAIEGGSASGKSTLAEILQEIYGCNVFHMDDFFLRPEQRTRERLLEIGGNIDRERFSEEILQPLQKKESVCFRPFDCSLQTLGDPITLPHRRMTVIEGVYSMHPSFGKYYTLSVFLDIDAAYQQERILVRNSPTFAKRFLEEWIPLEDRYFSRTAIKERTDLVLTVSAQK